MRIEDTEGILFPAQKFGFSVNEKEIKLDVEPNDLVHTIKMRIEDTEGIPFPVQKFHLER